MPSSSLAASRIIEKLVLVGTSVTRAPAAPIDPEAAHLKTLVVHGEARRHRAAFGRDGLGAPAGTACYGCSRGRPFLSWTIAAAEKSGDSPPVFAPAA
jgi:hypothetical protein